MKLYFALIGKMISLNCIPDYLSLISPCRQLCVALIQKSYRMVDKSNNYISLFQQYQMKKLKRQAEFSRTKTKPQKEL